MPMPMRLQELHPSLVHFPIALLPVALGADALGRLTGNETLLEVGKKGIALAAASGVVAGAAGFIAQQTVNLDDHTTDMLITHRDLNVGVVGLTALMAGWRAKRRRPTLGYLAAGLAGIGVVTYSAYLGGKMVYGHGVGVEPADGVRKDAAPLLDREHAEEATRLSARHLWEGLQVTAQEMSEGKIVPLLTGAGQGGDEEGSRQEPAPASAGA